MKHLISRAVESSAVALSEGTYARFLKETLPIYEREGLAGVSGELLKRIGIQVDVVQQDNPEFLLMRNRLNTRPGLIISNHPGYIDVPVVLQAIKRHDIKVMVTEKRYPQFTALYGDHFVPAPSSGTQAKNVLGEARRHIVQGGVFLLFPSGEVEARGGSKLFQSGFRALLEQLLPETMVYAFHVNKEDIQGMIQREKRNSMARITRVRIGIHPAPQFCIRLNETYTTCEQWQKAAQDARGSSSKNQALTEYYDKLFE
ncbi:MAG: 1-acyl-sn-glycerol-3-phosphate acyltransferase [Patescibacteria group bacterium]